MVKKIKTDSKLEITTAKELTTKVDNSKSSFPIVGIGASAGAEEALLESEYRFKDIFQTVDEGIVYTSLTGNVIEVNEALLRITGIPREELIGRNAVNLVRKLLPVKEISRLVSMVNQMIKGHSLAPFQLEYQNKALEISACISPHSHHLIDTIRDITERKQAEEALKQSEEKYRTLVDNIQDGVFIIQGGEMQFVNEAFARMVGYTVEEVIGMDFRQLVAPEDLEMVADRYRL